MSYVIIYTLSHILCYINVNFSLLKPSKSRNCYVSNMTSQLYYNTYVTHLRSIYSLSIDVDKIT